MGNQDDFLASIQERREQLLFTQRILDLTDGISSTNTVVSVDDNNSLRRLLPSEIATLERNGCSCRNWTKIFLLLSPPSEASVDQTSHLKELVSNNNLEGKVVFCISETELVSVPEPWSRLPMGIHNNLLIGSNSIVSTQSWICRNTVICDTHLYPSSVLIGCGSITGDSKLLAPMTISVGPESGGGRDLTLHLESDMIGVCEQLTKRKIGHRPLPSTELPNFQTNIVSRNCIVRDTPTIKGIYLASGSSIQAAISISKAMLLPGASIENGCVVEDVLLQWNSKIVDSSRVSETLLMEEAQIGPNSLVASTVLGPDVHVSAGEVHCSVLGPNTNSHHQSLVISVLWPLGRGNVGYGSNIGSNHTGRIPDQETTSGEGVFWGLSCVIKFPVDLTMAPYSIVAAGTALPPQRVCMPFSLIVSSNDEHNSIIPGWVLASSLYTIARSEKKYATRRKATRHKHYTGWKIIRPETIAMCQWARKQLVDAGSQKANVYATDKAIKGIGSNAMTEKGRLSGIKAYTDCIQKFALEGLLDWFLQKARASEAEGGLLQQEFAPSSSRSLGSEVVSAIDGVEWPLLPWEKNMSNDQVWQYQKSILLEEFPLNGEVDIWLTSLLKKFVDLENAYADKIYKCKSRDDQRGAQIVPGYADCHKQAESDPVVKEARAKALEVEAIVKGCIQDVAKFYRRRSKL